MNQSARELDGAIAVVTGAASGIGAAIARRFADAGARVCAGVRQEDDRAAVMRAAVRDSGGIVVLADVGSESAIDALFETVRRELGVDDTHQRCRRRRDG